jgi:hypothetical protein
VGGVLLSGLALSGTTHTNAGDYPGDTWTFTDSTGNYNNASGTVHHSISTATPTLAVSAGPTVVLGGGVPLTASATLANGSNAGGSITFTLYAPNGTVADSETATLGGNGTCSTPTGYTPALAGTYRWVASYAGDGNNAASTSKGSAAEVAVGPGATVVGGTLYLVGGNGNDQVNVKAAGASKTGSTGISVDATLNGSDRVQLGNGNNVVVVGTGMDGIQLGDGNNLIVGDLANDKVNTGKGHDALIDDSKPWPGSGESIEQRLSTLMPSGGSLVHLDDLFASLKVLSDDYGPR